MVNAFQPFRLNYSNQAVVTAVTLLSLNASFVHAQPTERPVPGPAQTKLNNPGIARTFQIPPRPVEVLSRALSPDGRMAVSMSSDGKIILWNTADSKEIRTIAAYAPAQRVSSESRAIFSPDSKLLFTLGGIEKQIYPVGGAKNQDQNGMFASSITMQGKLWDLATGRLLWTIPEEKDGNQMVEDFNTAAFSPDGKILATKARYAPINLWDTSTGKLLRTLQVPFIDMDALAFSPDGKTLAGGGSRALSYRSEVLLWDVESGDLQRSLTRPESEASDSGAEVTCVAFSPDGKMVVAGGSAGHYERINDISGRFNVQYGMAQVWDFKSGIYLFDLGRPIHREAVTNLAFSPDSTRLATGSMDKTVVLWNLQTGAKLGNVTGYGEAVAEKGTGQSDEPRLVGAGIMDLAFSADGATLDILAEDKSVRAWDVSTPSPHSDVIRHILPTSDSRYSCLTFSADSRKLVTGEYEKKVRIWSVADQREDEAFIAHSDQPVQVAFAPLGEDEPIGDQEPLLATASTRLYWLKSDRNSATGYPTGFEVKLWNSESRELKHTFEVPGFTVTALQISPRGRLVAAAGGLLGPLPPGAVAQNGGIAAMVGGVENADVPADATQKKSGIVMVWDGVTGELKQSYSLQGGFPLDLKFSADGTKLACDAGRAGIMLWDTSSGAKINTLGEDFPPPLKPGEQRMSFSIGGVKGQPTLAFLSDNLVARSQNNAIKIWNIKIGAVESTIPDPDATKTDFTPAIGLSSDGKTLAMTSPKNGFSVWDVETQKMLWRSPDKTNLDFMELSPDGKTVATSSGNGVRLWDISKVRQGEVN